MNTQLTELAFILDRSGSMESLSESAITGFNAFLKSQQETPGDARLTLALFDDKYLLHADSLPIQSVAPLDARTYTPRGSTALLDAIGRTIDDIGTRLSDVPESECPGKVIIAILTDGLENASLKYSMQDITNRIRHQRDTYQWEFLFLAANQDAIATAAGLGINGNDAANFCAEDAGVIRTTKAISSKLRAMRMSISADANRMTQQDKAAINLSMQDLVDSEGK